MSNKGSITQSVKKWGEQGPNYPFSTLMANKPSTLENPVVCTVDEKFSVFSANTRGYLLTAVGTSKYTLIRYDQSPQIWVYPISRSSLRIQLDQEGETLVKPTKQGYSFTSTADAWDFLTQDVCKDSEENTKALQLLNWLHTM